MRKKYKIFVPLYPYCRDCPGGRGLVQPYVCYFQLVRALEMILTLRSILIIFVGDVMPSGRKKMCCWNAPLFRWPCIKEIPILTTRCCICIDKTFGSAQGSPWTNHSLIINCHFIYHNNKETMED